MVTPEPTAEYGRYIATSIGNCVMCHTKLNLRTGGFDGPMFAGGGLHEAVNNPEKKYMAPNLTPDPRWGWLQSWDEKMFVARFHSGRVHADSPMPWERFQTLTDNDLLAIYRCLQTLPPAPRSGPDPRQREVELQDDFLMGEPRQAGGVTLGFQRMSCSRACYFTGFGSPSAFSYWRWRWKTAVVRCS